MNLRSGSEQDVVRDGGCGRRGRTHEGRGYQRADQPPKSLSSRRTAAPRKRLASLRRKSLSVGSPMSVANVDRQARKHPRPSSQPVTRASPASTRSGEPASEESNHGLLTRSNRASNGSTQAGPIPVAPQSTKVMLPPARRSRLSLRMSQ